MASSEKSSEQPEPEKKSEPVPKPKANPDPVDESKAGDDDPATYIITMRQIVETLHTIFPPAPVKPRAQPEQIRKSKSSIPPTSAPPKDQQANLDRQTSAPVDSLNRDESDNSIQKLKRNLRLLEEDVAKLKVLNQVVGEEVSGHIDPLGKLLRKVENGSSKTQLTKGMKKDLDAINKKIFNLMCQVPLLPNKRRKPGESDSDAGEVENDGKGIECLPGIHVNEEDLKRLAVFREVRAKFTGLSTDRQICLLSFGVFPENQEVNRTMLMYWWIGEDILPRGAKPEDAVKDILKEFMEKKLIEPVENKRKVEPNSYKMTPFVHSSVVLISEEIGLFNMYQKATKPKMKHSELKKVCLVEDSSSQPEAKAKKMPAEEIETVFNVSERFPDFAFKWFSEELTATKKKKFNPLGKTTFKTLKVFYLGRWERTAKRHIEVESPELMKYLKHMRKLRLLSFQGISRIERLDDAVCKLHELIILDLRACYNLEKLPDKIDSLKALIYLDITDCYMIDRMPKRLSWLDNLEVLKGFVVSDATDEETFCLLSELKHLKKLRKLSITINKGGEFTATQLFVDIEDFVSLEKLKVAWGGINEHKKDVPTVGVAKELFRSITRIPISKVPPQAKLLRDPKHLPKNLKKLDLQCFPDPELPSWLQPSQLDTLEKLYIKGGTKLTGFEKLQDREDPEEPTKCNVKVLRLKFLPRLKVEWRELRELYFPKLEFLDKYQCPQVSLCPCDGIGIWREKSKQL
ncbi:unnamed protein product [Thlaspi arvense]|uniref:Disease resistance R13L4/SHOC-2-like LRR domain-containing protein n=1 Tax=Thlaspi arvense TaxID=13288 RepID=A0AAU9RN95_THLAR|nr:unnamed protein product [Thlaspi arvense]